MATPSPTPPPRFALFRMRLAFGAGAGGPANVLDERARGGGAGAGAGAAVVIETAGLSSDGARRCGGRSGSKAAGGLASCAAGAHAAGSAAAASFRASWKPSSIDILDGRVRRPKCCASVFSSFWKLPRKDGAEAELTAQPAATRGAPASCRKRYRPYGRGCSTWKPSNGPASRSHAAVPNIQHRARLLDSSLDPHK